MKIVRGYRGPLMLIFGGLLLFGCRAKNEIHPVGEFLPETEKFWEVVPRESVIERIGINFGITDGPAWHPRGYLVFSDITANTVYRWTGRKFDSFRDSSNNANGLLFMHGGELLSCEHRSRSITWLTAEGELATLVDSYDGRRLNSPNDLCRSSSGAIYFTDPPWGLPEGDSDPLKELPYSGVFMLQNGRLTLIDSTLSWPNGIALSPDERYLYVANMEIIHEKGKDRYDLFWMRYTLNNDGKVTGRQVFFRAPDPSLPGIPDGMKVDQNGYLFVTGPGGILVLDSAGNHLGTISVPIPATNLAFGPRNNQIFVTAGSTVYRVTLR